MHAAVVTEFTRPPRFTEFDEPPVPAGSRLVAVEAAAVHRIVRSVAAGAHYSADGVLPLVPGVDGVARLEDGTRVYTGGPAEPFGMLAERAAVPDRFVFPVPETLDSALAAAIVNPAMSSWAPLAVHLRAGATVLVVGATGASGGLAVRIARHLGAGRVIAAGRNADALEALGAAADGTILLGGDVAAGLAEAAPEGVDLVLDYLWGTVAERLLEPVARAARASGRAVQWVQIGAVAGADIVLPSALLRQAPLTLLGSGIGSIQPAVLGRVIPAILESAAAGDISIEVETHPLAQVEAAWDRPGRLVFLP